MIFRIDADDGLAIYDQIVRQIKYAIASGTLAPGEWIPSVRELARQLTVNPNTIQRAYQQLQADGVLEPVRGRGLAVCRTAVKGCVAERQALVLERLEQVIAEALQGGVAPDDLRTLFERAVRKMVRSGTVEAG
ncbi:MAG: GntR family transcriptional regulator [Planctomycetaceae bacterium]